MSTVEWIHKCHKFSPALPCPQRNDSEAHHLWINETASPRCSFQEYASQGALQTESEYERRMVSVFSRVLEEVEGLAKKHPPVSFLVRDQLASRA